MKVLVTGHQGYIGACMVPLLQAAGHEVIGLDSAWFEEQRFGDDRPILLPTVGGDLRDSKVKDLRGFEAVVHLAGLSNDPLGDIDAGLTHEINTVASVRLAEMAKEAGVRRFLFSSSCSTYGAAGDAPLDESADFNPVTPYAVSKVEMEQALAELADDDFSPAYLRNATAYGVSSRLRMDLVLNNLVAWAYTTGKVRLLSDGSPWRPIVHIEDMSRVFLALLEAPREVIHDQAFNVGRSEENFRIRELAEIVAETVPDCELEIAPDAGPDKRSYRVDFSKLESTFPDLDLQWTARRGAQELLDAYRAAGLTFEQFDGPGFKRLGTIQGLIAAGRLDDSLRWT
ncbi:MAG: SDR family oxidoreductase [Thermoanaerobaculia bacterium]|nr:SDR family oxidoreductase [Thermoanaerobaculia bacterium]